VAGQDRQRPGSGGASVPGTEAPGHHQQHQQGQRDAPRSTARLGAQPGPALQETVLHRSKSRPASRLANVSSIHRHDFEASHGDEQHEHEDEPHEYGDELHAVPQAHHDADKYLQHQGKATARHDGASSATSASHHTAQAPHHQHEQQGKQHGAARGLQHEASFSEMVANETNQEHPDVALEPGARSPSRPGSGASTQQQAQDDLPHVDLTAAAQQVLHRQGSSGARRAADEAAPLHPTFTFSGSEHVPEGPLAEEEQQDSRQDTQQGRELAAHHHSQQQQQEEEAQEEQEEWDISGDMHSASHIVQHGDAADDADADQAASDSPMPGLAAGQHTVQGLHKQRSRSRPASSDQASTSGRMGSAREGASRPASSGSAVEPPAPPQMNPVKTSGIGYTVVKSVNVWEPDADEAAEEARRREMAEVAEQLADPTQAAKVKAANRAARALTKVGGAAPLLETSDSGAGASAGVSMVRVAAAPRRAAAASSPPRNISPDKAAPAQSKRISESGPRAAPQLRSPPKASAPPAPSPARPANFQTREGMTQAGRADMQDIWM